MTRRTLARTADHCSPEHFRYALSECQIGAGVRAPWAVIGKLLKVFTLEWLVVHGSFAWAGSPLSPPPLPSLRADLSPGRGDGDKEQGAKSYRSAYLDRTGRGD